MQHPTTMDAELQPISAANDWLTRFNSLEGPGDEEVLTRTIESLFVGYGWLRDLLVINGEDYHTVRGLAAVTEYIMRGAKLSNARLDTGTIHGGAFVEHTPRGDMVSVFFVLDVDSGGRLPATARGCARLISENGVWKAWTVLLVLQDLVGHEELRDGVGVHDTSSGNAGRLWHEIRREEYETVVEDLPVLIGELFA